MFKFRKIKRHDDIKRIIRNWSYKFTNYEAGTYSRHTSISFEVCGRNIYIYTDKPGVLIGLHGQEIDRLREMLKKENINKKINFVELGFGSMIREICVKRSFL